MKVLFVNNLYPPVVFGGYEILCHQVAEIFKKAGHTIHIVTSSFRADSAPSDPSIERTLHLTTDFPLPGEDVTHVDFSLSTIQRIARINRNELRRVIREFEPDVIFCWCLNRLSLGPVYAAQEAGIPVCYTMNDEHPKQFWTVPNLNSFRYFFRFLIEKYRYPLATFRNLDTFPIACISESLKKNLLKQNSPISRSQVIYQGVPMDQFPFNPAKRGSDESLNLMYAGQLSLAKGVHTILEACGQLKRHGNTGFVLNIYGSGVAEYERLLKDKTNELGLTDNIVFHGLIPHEKLTEAYHNSHIFIFSSEWEEPFGLTHIEAMACGCTVISTVTGGSSELIKDKHNALAYEAGNPEDLLSCIQILDKNEPLRTRLSHQAREYVMNHHSLTVYAQNLEKFVLQTIERGTIHE